MALLHATVGDHEAPVHPHACGENASVTNVICAQGDQSIFSLPLLRLSLFFVVLAH